MIAFFGTDWFELYLAELQAVEIYIEKAIIWKLGEQDTQTIFIAFPLPKYEDQGVKPVYWFTRPVTTNDQ